MKMSCIIFRSLHWFQVIHLIHIAILSAYGHSIYIVLRKCGSILVAHRSFYCALKIQ